MIQSVYGSTGFPSKRGSVAVEYGLVLPVLLLFVLGIMDSGRLLWTYATLNRAAEAAARCAAVNPVTCGTAAQIMSRQDIADYLGLTVETVCRTLSKLKRAGVVDLPRSNQLVQNLGSLRAFQNSCEERRAAPGPPDAPAAALADIR